MPSVPDSSPVNVFVSFFSCPSPLSLFHTVGPFHSFPPSYLYSDGALQYERQQHYALLMLQLLLRIHIKCSLIPYPSTGEQLQVRASLPRRSRSLILSHKSAYDFVSGIITSIEGITTFFTFFRLRLRLCRLQSSENQITVLASRSEFLLFGLVILLLLTTLSISVVTRLVSQWYGHPRVSGIPIPKILNPPISIVWKLKTWRTVPVIFLFHFFFALLHLKAPSKFSCS